MTKNKIIKETDTDKLNALIIDDNKKGWVVKQIAVYGLRHSTCYALLEKEEANNESGR